jgi:hypothetical protein
LLGRGGRFGSGCGLLGFGRLCLLFSHRFLVSQSHTSNTRTSIRPCVPRRPAP